MIQRLPAEIQRELYLFVDYPTLRGLPECETLDAKFWHQKAFPYALPSCLCPEDGYLYVYTKHVRCIEGSESHTSLIYCLIDAAYHNDTIRFRYFFQKKYFLIYTTDLCMYYACLHKNTEIQSLLPDNPKVRTLVDALEGKDIDAIFNSDLLGHAAIQGRNPDVVKSLKMTWTKGMIVHTMKHAPELLEWMPHDYSEEELRGVSYYRFGNHLSYTGFPVYHY